jgi:hypothetical protein
MTNGYSIESILNSLRIAPYIQILSYNSDSIVPVTDILRNHIGCYFLTKILVNIAILKSNNSSSLQEVYDTMVLGIPVDGTAASVCQHIINDNIEEELPEISMLPGYKEALKLVASQIGGILFFDLLRIEESHPDVTYFLLDSWNIYFGEQGSVFSNVQNYMGSFYISSDEL